eukprot:7065169-Lingulodinium_polyedra.AAC.1
MGAESCRHALICIGLASSGWLAQLAVHGARARVLTAAPCGMEAVAIARPGAPPRRAPGGSRPGAPL